MILSLLTPLQFEESVFFIIINLLFYLFGQRTSRSISCHNTSEVRTHAPIQLMRYSR
jgi:hypothetical protein